MTLPESPDNTVLVLDRPRVLRATQPVEGADIGVSLVIYDLVTDGEGATVEIDPPLSGTMNPGDVMELWLLGETTFLYSKIIEDENAITTLRIPKGRLHADRINELFYIINRGSQNIGNSPMLTMLYNKIRPGLKDIFPEVEGHSELELLLPDAIKNGVGPDFVSAQVCVSYPYCRAYDTITLKCNGEPTHFIVGRDEAPEPPDPGSPIATRVCFTVTRTHLEVAQRPNHELNFSYTVTDQLGNVPDTDAIWSATQTVDEDLAGTRLPAAILREILSEADDESGIIDLGKLGAYLYVIILVRDPRFEVGDFIEATYTGQSPGLPDVVMTVGGNVQADEFGEPVRVVLKIPNDKVVSVQTVTVKYVLKRNGEQKYSSREAKARVIGEAVTVPPVITRVTDSKGEIDNGGTTTETSITITITGSASVGQKVQLYDGDAPIGGELTAVGGIWTATMSVAVGVRSLTAKALYGSGQVSAAWVVNVTAVVAPTITSVKDAKDVEVPHNGFTVETSVTLTGTASKGQKVQILDGATSRGEATANATTGIWTLEVSALNVAAHSFTAKALYGSGQVSAAWVVNVTAVVAPTITSVKDAKDVEVPHNGFTVETSVTLTGTASKGQKVQILDGATSRGEATANATTGIWTLEVSALNVAAHSFTAKALYGSGQVTTDWIFTVVAAVTPEITSVKDPSSQEIANNANYERALVSTTVTLTGKATRNMQVEVFEGNASKWVVDVDATGTWRLPSVAVTVGRYSFKAKAKYGTQPESLARTFNFKARWSFNDGTFQGWVRQPPYNTGNNLYVEQQAGLWYVRSNTDANVNWATTIMNFQVPVRVGKFYNFIYSASANTTSNTNGTTLDIMVAGASGGTINTGANASWKSGTLRYPGTFSNDRVVEFALRNHTSTNAGNDFRITTIVMEERLEAKTLEEIKMREELEMAEELEMLEITKALEAKE
ncbi:Ig-like domain-containing protein [Pseudomonas sp. PDM09]|uniref:Ig-like domain-containing protein n=1 Tax=Pseudomonas sp. PDM09 TaxID=2769270 RepID=UPI00177C67E6|nr:Ig-like domain-containing protein [Pseudomonas sp. PDM09]MBD9563603.1 hypothetical protein [Pseudomonas sp. PDM09]